MGVHAHRCGELAPGDVAVAHAGLPNLRAQARRPSRHQSALSHRQYTPPLGAAAAPHGGVLAQRFRRRALCSPPLARRVGRLGGRTQGCAQHVLWSAVSLGVWPLRSRKVASRESSVECTDGEFDPRFPSLRSPSSILHPLSSFPVLLRPGPDEQAHAGDLALCDVAVGLVAPGPPPAFHDSRPFIGGRPARQPLATGGGRKPPSSCSRLRRAWSQ